MKDTGLKLPHLLAWFACWNCKTVFHHFCSPIKKPQKVYIISHRYSEQTTAGKRWPVQTLYGWLLPVQVNSPLLSPYIDIDQQTTNWVIYTCYMGRQLVLLGYLNQSWKCQKFCSTCISHLHLIVFPKPICLRGHSSEIPHIPLKQ